MAFYCPQGSGTLRQQLLMMHGIALYCMVLHGISNRSGWLLELLTELTITALQSIVLAAKAHPANDIQSEYQTFSNDQNNKSKYQQISVLK